jgi:preprotein translocase subunit SecF
MEFFREVNVDWMGKAKYFVGFSLLLLIVGAISVATQGLTYGIDFRGGTVITMRFAQPPPTAEIRNALSQAGLPNSSLQPLTDPSDPHSKNDLLISLEQKGNDENASLDTDRQTVINTLYKVLGEDLQGKPDFNSTSTAVLTEFLTQKDLLTLGANAGDRYIQLAAALTKSRDNDYGGLVTSFNQLSGVSGATPAVISALGNNYGLGGFVVRDAQTVGPTVGKQLRSQAIWATLYALGGMLVYVAIRFSGGGLLRISTTPGKSDFFLWKWVDYAIFGLAAVIAVFHDVLITLGLFSLTHYQISLTVIAALLTLVGYSMNDTIVIFDRIRENARLMRREPFKAIVNRSINQTLSRTILTSGLTFLTVLVLFLMGGQVLRAFSFALVVGILVGTYSSFGIAAPLVVAWNQWRGQGGAVVASGTAAGTKLRKA